MFGEDTLSSLSQLLSYTNFPGEAKINSSEISAGIKHINDLISIMYSPEHTIVVYTKQVKRIALLENVENKRGVNFKNILHPRVYNYFLRKRKEESLNEIGLLQYFQEFDLSYKLKSSLVLDQLNSVVFKGNNQSYECVLCLDVRKYNFVNNSLDPRKDNSFF